MNRLQFFRNLALGAAAVPAAVKAMYADHPFTFRKVNEWQPGPRNYFGEIEFMDANDIQWDYRWEGDRLIQSCKGKDCLIYRVDPNPLRFSA